MLAIVTVLLNIVSAIIFLLIGIYWKSKFIPWLSKYKYNGIYLNGQWEVLHEKKTSQGYNLTVNRKIIVFLNQTGNIIKGKAISTPLNNQDSKNYEFIIEGSINDGFVYISFNSENKLTYVKTVYYLRVQGDGSNLDGYQIFYGTKKNEINSRKIQWKRINTSNFIQQ